MASRALTILRLGSLASRALPIGPLSSLAEAAGARIGPRLMAGKAGQLQRHIQRVADIETPNAADEPIDAERAMRQGFGSYSRYWVESFRIPFLTDRTIDRGFSFVGYHKIEQVRASGVGPLLVLPHLGGWEWAAAWLGRIAKVDVTAVVEELEPPEVFDWFSRLRQAYGVHVVPLGPRAMVELLAAVKRRDVICLLSDRDISGNGVAVRFFGEETTLPAGPALLARRSGAPLLPAAVFFHGRQRVCVIGDPFWPDQFEETGRELNRRIMQEVAHRLEELIAQAPDQWHLLEPNWPSDHQPG